MNKKQYTELGSLPKERKEIEQIDKDRKRE